MQTRRFLITIIALLLATALLGVGYAVVTDDLSIIGNMAVDASPYNVYISSLTPATSGGVSVTGYLGTAMSVQLTSAVSGKFRITVTNVSNKRYVFERVIEGWETNIDGIYTGTDVTYTLNGLSSLQEQGADR